MAKQLRGLRHRALISTVKRLRAELKLNQRDFSTRLERSESFIGKVESGERALDVLEFWEMADKSGHDPKQLFAQMVDHARIRTRSKR